MLNIFFNTDNTTKEFELFQELYHRQIQDILVPDYIPKNKQYEYVTKEKINNKELNRTALISFFDEILKNCDKDGSTHRDVVERLNKKIKRIKNSDVEIKRHARFKKACKLLSSESNNKLYKVQILQKSESIFDLHIKTTTLGHVMRICEFNHDFKDGATKKDTEEPKPFQLLRSLFGEVIYKKRNKLDTKKSDPSNDVKYLFSESINEELLARLLLPNISSLGFKVIDGKLNIISTKTNDLYDYSGPSSLPSYVTNEKTVVCSDSGPQVPLILQNLPIDDLITSKNAPFTNFDAGPQPNLRYLYEQHKSINTDQASVNIDPPRFIAIHNFDETNIIILIQVNQKKDKYSYTIIDYSGICDQQIEIENVSITNVINVFYFFTIHYIHILHVDGIDNSYIKYLNYNIKKIVNKETTRIIYNFLKYLSTVINNPEVQEIIYFLYTIFFLKSLGDLVSYSVPLLLFLEKKNTSLDFSYSGILSSGDYSLLQTTGLDIEFYGSDEKIDMDRTINYKKLSIISMVHLPNQNDMGFPITEKEISTFNLALVIHNRTEIESNIGKHLKPLQDHYSFFLNIDKLNIELNREYSNILFLIRDFNDEFLNFFYVKRNQTSSSEPENSNSTQSTPAFYLDQALFQPNITQGVPYGFTNVDLTSIDSIDKNLSEIDNLLQNLNSCIQYIQQKNNTILNSNSDTLYEILCFCNKFFFNLQLLRLFLNKIKVLFHALETDILKKSLTEFNESLNEKEDIHAVNVDENTFLFAKIIVNFLYNTQQQNEVLDYLLNLFDTDEDLFDTDEDNTNIVDTNVNTDTDEDNTNVVDTNVNTDTDEDTNGGKKISKNMKKQRRNKSKKNMKIQRKNKSIKFGKNKKLLEK